MKQIHISKRRALRLVFLSLALLPATLFATGSFLFETTGSLATARSYHTATLLPDGRVLASGGHTGRAATATAEVYDPATGVWTPTGSMGQARVRHSATLLPDGSVLVVGGQSSGDGLTSAEIYDPGTGTWRDTGSLAEGRASHTANLLPDGRPPVSGGGGTGGTGPVASAEIYDPEPEPGLKPGTCWWRGFGTGRVCCQMD